MNPDAMTPHGLALRVRLVLVAILLLFAWPRLHAQRVDTLFVQAPALFPTLVRVPDDFDSTRSYTVVAALHGFGGNPQGFMSLAPLFSAAGIVFAAVQAPYWFVSANRRLGFDWSLAHLDERDLGDRAADLTIEYLANLVAELRSAFSVDGLYLMGFSQGAGFAYLAGIRDPEAVEGLIAFGSGFSASCFSDESLQQAKDLRIFIAHGDSDAMVSIARAEIARDTLEALGYDVTFRRFAGGHDVPPGVVGEVIRWIGRR